MKTAEFGETLADRVYRLLLEIPPGRVVTYGQLAAAAGCRRGARAVGNILHRNPRPDRVPCFKVVNARGELAEHFGAGGKEGQRQRLEADGVEVNEYRVDLVRCGWRGWEKPDQGIVQDEK